MKITLSPNKTFIIASIIFLVILCPFYSAAQEKLKSGSLNSTATQDKKIYPAGSAWSLTYPLGIHKSASIDTVLYNYQRQFVTALNSDAWACTGTFGAEGINMIFFDRPKTSDFLFSDALSHYLPSFKKEKFYNVFIPMTLLSYNFGGGQTNQTDRLKAVFAGNVNKHWGFGANIDYLYSKGNYNSSAAKNLINGFTFYYDGDRYEAQAFYNHFNEQNQENGGITNDLYIQDPAVLQGGVDNIEPMSIPTRLNGSQNQLNGTEVYFSNAYKLGFWRDDSQKGDTIRKMTYVPVTKFIYSFNYKYNHRTFKSTKSEDSNFWESTYFNPNETFDDTYYWNISNTIGIASIEGFQTWAKFGLSAYATYEIDNFKQQWQLPETTLNSTTQLTPIPASANLNPDTRRNSLWIGGRLEKMKGRILKYAGNAKLGMLGDALGDIDINGEIETRFRLAKDTVIISANGFLHNKRPSYLLKHYISNHFIWNNDFGNIREIRAEGRLFIPWTKTTLRAGVENIQNYIYFNPQSLPTQHSGNIQVLSASIDQKLNAGIWNWDNTITYQTSSNKNIIPLPSIVLYSNMYLGFKAFNVLQVQVGLDCDYYTKYKGLEYQPATMSFHTQGANPIYVGNFALLNAYFTAKLQKTRFFILWSHCNQGLFGSNYFSMPHYPIAPRQLRFGLSVDFSN